MPVVTYTPVNITGILTANTFIGGDQHTPDVLGLDNGGFVVGYHNGDTLPGFELLNFFDAAGVTPGFTIPYASAVQTDAAGAPSLTQLTNGNVVVVWDDNHATTPGLVASIFTQTGALVTPEFNLTDFVSDMIPQVAALTGGGFAVANQFLDEIFLEIYNNAGGVVVSEFFITDATELDSDPAIAGLADGGLVVVWVHDAGVEGFQLRGSIYNANGTLRAGNLVLDNIGDNTQPSVAALPNGAFAVAYADTGWALTGEADITLGIWDANGQFLNWELVNVGSGDGLSESNPDVTVLENEFIVVSYTDPFNTTPTDLDIWARVLDHMGDAITGFDPFTLDFTGNVGDFSSISTLSSGRFVGAWQDSATDGAGGRISFRTTEIVRTTIGEDTSEGITGDELMDVIMGMGGADTLQGMRGNDILEGGAGSDALHGGDGIDASGYAIASTAASWTRHLDGSWTVTAGADGTDLLTGIEFLDFIDRSVFLDRAARTFSGDGGSDILWRNASGQTVIWGMNGETVAGAGSTSIQVGLVWSVIDTGDFNNDGRDDVLWRNTSGQTVIWQMNGASVSQAGATSVQVGNVWSVQGIGDFNLDGRDDILWRNTSGQTVIWQMDGTSVAQAGATSAQVGNVWQIAGIGDFNGDGRDDFAWRHDNGLTAIWHMNGTTVASSGVTSLSAGLNWDIAGVGDFNGDGRDDLLWRNTNGQAAIWHMNGTTAQGALTSIQVGNAWAIAAVGDYNGDGRDDILWRNTNGVTVLWEMNGANVIDASNTSVQVGNDWGII